MRLRLALVPALCVAAGLAAPALASGPAHPAARVAVKGGAPLALKGLVDHGAAPATTRQQVVLALALRDSRGLDALLAQQQTPGSAHYRQFLSPAQFAARFSPTTASVGAVRSWAKSAGLTVSSVSDNRTLVTLTGTATQVGAAFGTTERRVTAAGQTFLMPAKAATLPASIASVTKAVTGLSTFRTFSAPTLTRTKAVRSTPVTTSAPYQTYGLASYTPADFWKMYDAPATVTGTGQSAAIITSGDLTSVKKDLTTFEGLNKLPKTPLTVVGTGPASTDASGADEYDLDSQYTLGFAPGLKTLIAYNATALGDVSALNKVVTDKKVLTASASYGGCEVLNEVAGEVDTDDQVFKQATAQGQTFWFSSGDEGSACSLLVNTGYPAGVPDVEYPSSSPYVVAVGGTSLTGQTTQPAREISWTGGGGGYSLFETAPSWQSSSLEFQSALGQRGVPDVSLDADPNSGYSVIVGGAAETIGGTSASTPAWNGIWARVMQKHAKLGFAAPVLYRNATRGGLVDITLGTNGMYAATPGYDLTTGLGTADIAKLVATTK